jgi:sulfite exporter TauE/SafE
MFDNLWRKAIFFIVGFILTTLGITLVLQQWQAVVLVFKAFIGAFLAVIGLVILFASTLN